MGTRIQGYTDIARQSTDISTFTTHHTDLNDRQVAFQQLHLIDHQCLRLQLHFFTFTRQFIGTFPIHFAGRKDRRNLLYRSYKRIQYLFHPLPGYMFRRIYGVYLLFQVKRRGRFSQLQGSDIFFRLILEFVDPFGCPAGTNDHHSGSQRIKCSGMSDFYFFYFQLPR